MGSGRARRSAAAAAPSGSSPGPRRDDEQLAGGGGDRVVGDEPERRRLAQHRARHLVALPPALARGAPGQGRDEVVGARGAVAVGELAEPVEHPAAQRGRPGPARLVGERADELVAHVAGAHQRRRARRVEPPAGERHPAHVGAGGEPPVDGAGGRPRGVVALGDRDEPGAGEHLDQQGRVLLGDAEVAGHAAHVAHAEPAGAQDRRRVRRPRGEHGLGAPGDLEDLAGGGGVDVGRVAVARGAEHAWGR